MSARRVADIIALADLGFAEHVIQCDAADADLPNHGEWLLINDLVRALEHSEKVRSILNEQMTTKDADEHEAIEALTRCEQQVEALRKERDEAIDEFQEARNTSYLEQAEAADARLTVVREALATYGQHKWNCKKMEPVTRYYSDGTEYTHNPYDCTCGFAAALRVDSPSV